MDKMLIGRARFRFFQRVQQLIDRGKLRVLFEEALRIERVGDLRNQIPAHAAEVSERRQDPDGRRAEGDDAKHFDCVTRSPPGEEITRQRPLGAGGGGRLCAP